MTAKKKQIPWNADVRADQLERLLKVLTPGNEMTAKDIAAELGMTLKQAREILCYWRKRQVFDWKRGAGNYVLWFYCETLEARNRRLNGKAAAESPIGYTRKQLVGCDAEHVRWLWEQKKRAEWKARVKAARARV